MGHFDLSTTEVLPIPTKEKSKKPTQLRERFGFISSFVKNLVVFGSGVIMLNARFYMSMLLLYFQFRLIWVKSIFSF